MAEPSGQSPGRKRKATVESSPIVQLRFSQRCRCAGCSKAAVCRPLGRRSARLAAKQQKRGALPLDHERKCSKNAVVYEICGFAEASHWPTGARHLYRISTERLTIVDLLRNTYKQLKPRAWWNRDAYITDMTVVSAYAILVSIHVRDVQRDELHLLRFTKEGDRYKRTLLHGAEDSDLSAFALVQIAGQGVDVKRAVVGDVWGGPIVFLRVDIDKARAVVVETVGHPFRESQDREFVAHFNEDGRELLAIHKEDPQVLQVYSLAERKWTKHELDGLNGGHNTFFWYRFSPSGRIYAQGDDAGSREFLFRCDAERKKWERVPVEAREIGKVAFVANSADGREDGVLTCRTEEMPSNSFGQAVDRLRIERRMFRNPDSLLRQAFVAVRKLHEGVHVEEVIRELVDAAGMSSAILQKKFFPSAYDGMMPIPVRFHQ